MSDLLSEQQLSWLWKLAHWLDGVSGDIFLVLLAPLGLIPLLQNGVSLLPRGLCYPSHNRLAPIARLRSG